MTVPEAIDEFRVAQKAVGKVLSYTAKMSPNLRELSRLTILGNVAMLRQYLDEIEKSYETRRQR